MAEPTLVSRESELEELMHCLDSAANGKGTTVFVSGEAGAGKTRLVSEFLSRASKKGTSLLSGWCPSDTAIPYLPFAEAFRKHFAADEGTEIPTAGSFQAAAKPEPASVEGYGITGWLSSVGNPSMEKPATVSPQIWKDQLFTAVAETLHSISIQQPVLLLIEDVHWADSASLALLHYIARVINQTERILVLATLRSEELTADAEGRAHPLAEIMRLMKREDLYREIKLAKLDQTTIAKIAQDMLKGTIHPEFAQKLAKESQGNPLYLVESLRMLSEQNQLVQENNEWRLCAEEVGIPSKFKDIILRRLGTLTFSQRRMLDAASVIGEKFNIDLLGAALSQNNLEVLESLNTISQSTSLVSVEGELFRFHHAKVREAIYGEIPLPLRRGYHARIAETVEGKGEPLPLGDIAHHYTQAGNKEKASKYALAAGEDALAKFSNTEAIKNFTYVLQNSPDFPKWTETKSTALEGLGDAYYINGMFAKAIDAFEQLAESETGKVKLRAYRKAIDAVFFGIYNQAHLLDFVKKAEPYAASDRLESARIRMLKATSWDVPTMSKNRKEFEAVLQAFEEEYSLPDVARTLTPLAISYSDLKKGLGMNLRSVAMLEQGDQRDLIRDAILLGAGFFGRGLYKEAYDYSGKVVQLGEKIGDINRMVLSTLRQGTIMEMENRVEDALSKTLKAAEYAKKSDANEIQEHTYPYFVKQYAKLGEIKRAEEFFNKLSSTIKTERNSLMITLSRAVFFAAKNQWDEAQQYFDKAFKLIPTNKSATHLEVIVRTEYGWALEKQGRVEDAKIQLKKIRRIRKTLERRFAHVDIQAHFMARRRVLVGEEFEMYIDLVNVSRKPGALVKAEGLVPSEFEATELPADYCFENMDLNMKQKVLAPFRVEIIKLKLRALKPGDFTWRPKMTYIDERGQTKTCCFNALTINVQNRPLKNEVLPGRISTGLDDLDRLLFGGIPENYGVVLASPSTDARDQLIRHFLEAGAKSGETTFYITTKPADAKTLAEDYPSDFHLVVCNPRADTMIQDAPNISKLKGVENLTEIDIALTKAFRTLKPSADGPKRICIDLVSDVLLQHHPVTTRRWLSSLLPTLRSRGFTVLAVIDSIMHPIEEAQAVLGLFDCEISIYEKETPQATTRFLRIKRMAGQKYLKDEIPLTGE